MIDWSDPNGLQLKALQAAVLHAFPNPSDLKQLLLFELDKNYVQIVGGGADYATAVLDVLLAARGGGWLPGFVQAVIRERPNNPRVRTLLRAQGFTKLEVPAGRSVEDIMRKEDGFADVMVWLEHMDALATQICRIECPLNQGVGTGWLVGADLLLTNWHVVRKVLSGDRKPTDYACRFDYATTSTGTGAGTVEKLAANWCVDFSPASSLELGEGADEPGPEQLDYALLRLASAVGDQPGPGGKTRGGIRVSRGAAVPAEGSIMLVLQHESGNPLKLSIGTAHGTNATGTRVLHDANTQSGSSGSPCFNAKLDLVALHNAGDPLYDGVTGSPSRNRGVPIDLILSRMERANAPRFWQ